jgi:hypothetical protein
MFAGNVNPGLKALEQLRVNIYHVYACFFIIIFFMNMASNWGVFHCFYQNQGLSRQFQRYQTSEWKMAWGCAESGDKTRKT